MGFSKVVFVFLILALAMVAAGETLSKSSISGRRKVEDQTETSHHLLAGKRKAISYKALENNAAFCNQHGRSNHDCHRRKPINPYTRGCSITTRCARIYK
ncbi:hypothetical protein V6N13_023468 [Hibiscus sabdariffa]|uniref:Uncharacterized protein n=2 Tax=Hibiscus sabdariffa TaxID=183260 RepID=A0ABR2PLX0_9ROSI